MSDLTHYGKGHLDGGHSGRYPWGSGDNPFQHTGDFAAEVNKLRDQNMKDADIAVALLGEHATVSDLRKYYSIDNSRRKLELVNQAKELYSKNDNNLSEVARQMNVSESTLRGWLKSTTTENLESTQVVVDRLKKELETKKYLDVGKGEEIILGVTETKLKTALKQLEMEGYVVFNDVKINQAATNHRTTFNVLAPPGTTYSELYSNLTDIKSLLDYQNEEGLIVSTQGIRPPVGIDRSRILVRYAEEGGTDRDGTIEIRPGVSDLDLGDSRYAQVRIQMGDKAYMKGMAFYNDKIPAGYDIIYNTNKPLGTPDMPEYKGADSVFKKLKDDPNNPFGASIQQLKIDPETGLLKGGQYEYKDKNGDVHLGAINKINDQGDWNDWSKNLSSQFLSKQEPDLIKRQLLYSLEERRNELDEIMHMTQATIQKERLKEFGEDCDKQAAYLKAEALPRQSQNVILPIPTLNEGECYCPSYRDGEKIALIRHPHEGTFQIPVVTNNLSNPEGRRIIGTDSIDAIGITKKTADKMSGADFDGDSVIAIPISQSVRITSTDTLEKLKDFDTSIYKIDRSVVSQEQYPTLSEDAKQIKMGIASNLITDMTIQGAPLEEIQYAVRYSMTIIDSVKHDLDYKQAYKDNHIAEYKKKYQSGGASTIISRAKSPVNVNERTDGYTIDPKTGEKIYRETGRTIKRYVKDEEGNVLIDPTTGKKIKEDTGERATTEVYRMSITDDPYTLTSGGSKSNPGNAKEALYAEYATQLKALANEARKQSVTIKDDSYSKLAAETYAPEVESIMHKLEVATLNAPRERQALLVSNAEIRAACEANPDLRADKDKYKRVRTTALNAARTNLGAKKVPVNLTEKEWEAIQHGAIKKSIVLDIYKNADKDRMYELASPKTSKTLSDSQVSLIKAMKDAGYTLSYIADRFGVSPSTISKAIKK